MPVGILSHHDRMASDFMSFMVDLFRMSSEYGARWLRGSELIEYVTEESLSKGAAGR